MEEEGEREEEPREKEKEKEKEEKDKDEDTFEIYFNLQRWRVRLALFAHALRSADLTISSLPLPALSSPVAARPLPALSSPVPARPLLACTRPPSPRPPSPYLLPLALDLLAFARERAVGIDAVVRASRVCQHVFKALVTGETLTKKDKSPVTGALGRPAPFPGLVLSLSLSLSHAHAPSLTPVRAPSGHAVADFSAQAVVNTILMREFPQDPIVGEEDTKDLRGPEAATLQAKVVELANSVLPAPRTANEVL